MRLVRHATAAAYAGAALPFLGGDEARYCMGLGTLDEIRRFPDRFREAQLFTFADEAGAVHGAAWLAPPLALGFTACGDEVLAALGDELATAGVRPGSIGGPARETARFFDQKIGYEPVADVARYNLAYS